MKTEFEVKGYSKDYLIDGKYVGSEKIENKDRDILGYSGRITEILNESKKFKRKTYKKGTSVVTELHQICGKITSKKK